MIIGNLVLSDESIKIEKEKEQNISLRKEILEQSLDLEYSVNELILRCLGIEKEQTKAFSNKSSSLSFKNKIDLLYDIEVLQKDEHLNLDLFMIFRNQFIHNINCNSFTAAIQLFDKGIENRLLKFNDLTSNYSQEFCYSNAYRNLHLQCLETIKDKLSNKRQSIEDKKDLLINSLQQTIYFIDTFYDFFHELCDKYKPDDNDTAEIIKLKLDILKTYSEKLEGIKNNERYKLLTDKRDELMNENNLKNILR